ncbi:retrovirus-related pol polyprotein from transposon TNT 1-94 [Tanacetum coccineum]
MVNTRTDAELAAAVQAAVDAMLPQIREQVREEYRTGAVASGSNPPPVTIHTWLERFNKQKPRSFEKAVAPVDAENWISHMEKIFDVMDCNDAFKTRLAVYKFEGDALAWWKAYKQAKGGDVWVLTLTWAAFKELFFLQFFPRAEQERLKREYHSIRQRASENSTEYMQRFLRLAGFLGQAAGTAEEQAKNFRWGLHKSILDHVMCIQFTDVAQVADAARNLEILRDRDDYDRSERSDKRHKSGDRYQSATQQNSYRGHDQKNDRQGSDRQGGGGNYRNNNNNNYSRDNNRSNLNRYRLYLLYDMNLTSRHGNRNSGAGRDQRNRGSQQSRVPSEGYTHPVCNTCGRRHPGECRRAAGTCFKCGQAGHLQRDCKKNIGASSSSHADKKPDASGRVFALTQDQAANTLGDHIWIAFGGNTRDLGLVRNGQYYNSTPKSLEEFCIVPGDGVAIPSDVVISYKRRRQDFQDGVKTYPPQKKPLKIRVGIKSLLNAVSITVALIDINVAQSKLYKDCLKLRLLEEVTYDHSTLGHNRVIQIRGGVLAESSQSNEFSIGVKCNTCRSTIHSTSDHNKFDHFKREGLIRESPSRYCDNGCSRSMTGVKSYLHKYVEQPGPKVVFGDNSSCITEGYGLISCGGIVFTKIAFVNSFKYNLISISQLYNAKYIVQFDDKQGIIFNANKEIVLIAPKRNDVYVLDMSSLTPNGACFFAKASESVNWLWHKSLSHLNLKNINKLANQNKVLVLRSLVYSKDKPCTSCEKGASLKTKQNFSIRKCLHLLHMDLFWTVRMVENQNDVKVKQIRTDNGTEFRNHKLESFCDEKGISQNFSSPYTPEQNGVAERKNRTLIEAARTMLNGSVLSKHFWTDAVRIACYTQNRSIIVKRHDKTSYEIFRERIPDISYFHVFGCLCLFITKEFLQFDAKADDGYFLGYSSVSKAFRVYNTRRQQIEETYHVTFDESMEAIRFTNTSVDEIGIDDSSRYPPDEFQEDDPSRQYNI